MGQDQQLVRITAGDVRAALPLAEPEPDHGSKQMAATLDIMQQEPGGFGKLFKSRGVGLSFEIHPFQPGGPHHYFADVQFPRRLDLEQAFRRTGLEWPVWWVVDDVSHLIDKMGMKMLSVSGFGRPEYVLEWFVRLHAVLTESDPFAPVFIRRTVSKIPDGDGSHHGIDSMWELMREVNDSMQREATDELLKQQAYEEWLEREAEWKRSTGQA
jgi:hypothetical protein